MREIYVDRVKIKKEGKSKKRKSKTTKGSENAIIIEQRIVGFEIRYS